MRRILLPLGLAALLLGLAACNSALDPQGGPQLQAQGAKSSLDVVKTATPYSTPGTWTLTKTAATADGQALAAGDTVTVAPGSSTTLSYQVVATPTGGDATVYGVKGTVTVTNGLVSDITLASVVDQLPLPGSTTPVSIGLTCYDPSSSTPDAPIGFPYTLTGKFGSTPAGSITCSYDHVFSGTPPLDTQLTNGATASGSYISGGTTYPVAGDGSAAFSFAAAGSSPIAITDSLSCPTGFTCSKTNESTATATDGTVTYSYDVVVTAGASLPCGTSYPLNNTAGIQGTDTTASLGLTLSTGTCAPPPPPPPTGGNCYTQGYWKTHSSYGPANPADPTWNDVGGPDATFFYSGMSWIELFNTPPSRGNAYIQLAHQYMAAVLNVDSGAAASPDVQAAMSWAHTYFDNASNKPSSYTDAQQARYYANVLDAYNSSTGG
ncbi:MAG TPA: hypothetical protein VKB31_00110 [Trueperaceae bacterium]|nr:hypothetical protein [Trueperaceae bacterium]